MRRIVTRNNVPGCINQFNFTSICMKTNAQMHIIRACITH